MTKEELIEKMKNGGRVEKSEKVLKILKDLGFLYFDGSPIDLDRTYGQEISVYKPETRCNYYHISDGAASIDFTEKEFLSWFKEEAPKKKRGPKPKLNKRERAEARLSQVEETTKKAFTCEHNGKLLGSYDGHYWLCSESGPEEAVIFAKWIIDLEGK
jgi:hypothetical protein